jgi:RNA polymerase sigma-70 factor (ECF subfamily)
MLDRSSATSEERAITAEYAAVRRLCARLVDVSTADDLAQETFLRAAGARTRFRADSASSNWLAAIARCVCMDELRRRYRARRQMAAIAGAIVSSPAARDVAQGADDALEVRELLRDLEPDRRSAFVLTQLIGLSYAEAAVACRCPVGTIRSRVARARGDLLELTGGRARA